MTPAKMTHYWENLRHVPRLLMFIWQSSRKYTILATFSSLVQGLVAPTQVWVFKVIVDRIGLAVQGELERGDWLFLLIPLGWMVCIWSIGNIGSGFATELQTLLGFKVRLYTEHRLLEKCSQLDVSFFETSGFHDRMENARQTLGHAHNIPILMLNLLSSLVSACAMLALVARLHWLAVVVLVAAALPQLLLRASFVDRMWQRNVRHTPGRRMVKYLSDVLASREGVKEMRIFRLQGLFLERFAEFWDGRFGEEREIRLKKESINGVLGLLSSVGTGLVWCYTVVQAVVGRVTIGDVTMIFQAANQSRSLLSGILGRSGVIYQHSIYGRTLFEFLDLSSQDVEGSLEVIEPRQQVPLPIETIEFRKVGFRYPAFDRDILQDVSFTIRAGERVAVVGTNGAGKTTLVKLLARLYDPTSGKILIYSIVA